jgi:hypothetical protein
LAQSIERLQKQGVWVVGVEDDDEADVRRHRPRFTVGVGAGLRSTGWRV